MLRVECSQFKKLICELMNLQSFSQQPKKSKFINKFEKAILQLSYLGLSFQVKSPIFVQSLV